MLVNTLERDARNDGWKAGVAHGLAEGKSLGLAEGKSLGLAEGKSLGLAEGKSLGLAEGEIRGSRQAKVETAKNLLQFGLSIENIVQATGLSKAEVEAL